MKREQRDNQMFKQKKKKKNKKFGDNKFARGRVYLISIHRDLRLVEGEIYSGGTRVII